MFNFPDPKTIEKKERIIQRTLEMIPGILTWVTFIGMFALSFFLPVWVAIFVIVFDVYWIFRTIFIASYSVAGYQKLKKGREIDWWERCQNIKDPVRFRGIIQDKIQSMKQSLKEKNSMSLGERRILGKFIWEQKKYLEEVIGLEKIKDQILDWRGVVMGVEGFGWV